MLRLVPSNSQVNEAGPVIDGGAGDVLGGLELQGDSPLLAKGGQGGQQVVLCQLKLPRVGEGAWNRLEYNL